MCCTDRQKKKRKEKKDSKNIGVLRGNWGCDLWVLSREGFMLMLVGYGGVFKWFLGWKVAGFQVWFFLGKIRLVWVEVLGGSTLWLKRDQNCVEVGLLLSVWEDKIEHLRVEMRSVKGCYGLLWVGLWGNQAVGLVRSRVIVGVSPVTGRKVMREGG